MSERNDPGTPHQETTTLSEFFEMESSGFSPEELFDEADTLDEHASSPLRWNAPQWTPAVDLGDDVDTTTSSRSKADASGKVTITFIYRIEPSGAEAAQLQNYISEAQNIRRHGAHILRSFQSDQWGGQSPVNALLKEHWNRGRTTLISGNVQDNLNRVGEAFASWEANGYREQGGKPPQFGSQPYVVVRNDYIKDPWQTDSDRYGITLQLGKTRGARYDPNRKHTFSFLLDYGNHQAKAIRAVSDGNVQFGRAEIHHRDGDWFLHLSVSYEQPVYDWKALDRWIGIDLGTVALYTLAVLEEVDEETGASPKENGVDVLAVEHGAGQELMHERRQQKEALRHLQQTRGYEYASKKLGERLSKHSIQLEHEYANQIVRLATEYAPCGLVFEDIKGMGGMGWGHLWSYFRFKQVVTYKAHQEGIPTLTLSKPETRNTSKECSVCGSNPETHDKAHGGRITRDQYRCDACGYGPVDADTNAAINIGRRVCT